MQNNFLTTIRSLKIIDGCKGAAAQLYAFNAAAAGPSTSGDGGANVAGDIVGRSSSNLRSFSLRSSKSMRHQPSTLHRPTPSAVVFDTLLPCGLPSLDAIDPAIDPFFRPLDLVAALADSYRRLSAATKRTQEAADGEATTAIAGGEEEASAPDLCDLHLEQFALLRTVGDGKLQRRALRAARVLAPDAHRRVVLSAWLRYERREDELDPTPPPLASCTPTSPVLECPRAALTADPSSLINPLCPCRRPVGDDVAKQDNGDSGKHCNEEEADLWFVIGEEEVPCSRSSIAALSPPLNALLYGGFAEAKREKVNFTRDGISVRGMRTVDRYSRAGAGETILEGLDGETVLELLSFSNRYCCEGLKEACDKHLAAQITSSRDAVRLIDAGLDETAHLLVGACLQAFLRDLPAVLSDNAVARILCGPEGRERLEAAGHASFALYFFLSHVAMEEDLRSNATVMLLERLCECAAPGWQRQLALHQLGCVMLERGEYKDAQCWFEEAVEDGHLYSLLGAARAMAKRGHKYAAYKLMNSLLDAAEQPAGWMYQERSVYCVGKEKAADLAMATKLDPTLAYPYKYRAVVLLEEDKIGAAIAEINKILTFMVTTDCLELRGWLYIVLEDYESAMQDLRVLMTLDPSYMVFHGRVSGDQLIDALASHVQQLSMADCWMQLYDRWSVVDDMGSLAVMHQMLAKDSRSSNLRFRQSLLLLRLNSPKAAMRSLRLARNNSTNEHERLVYEGWILYDTGDHEAAVAKVEESIRIQRSFEAFFLKAYALSDSGIDASSALTVIQLLEQANSCASDYLRKGQACYNMGTLYVDCDQLEKGAECFLKALGIKHTRAHQGLARVYHLKNQKKEAYDEMTKLIEKAKNNASAYEKRSEYCEDRAMALADLDVATRLDPTRTYPYRYRAAVLMDDQKEREAIAELSRAIAFRPDLSLLYLRASFHDSVGDTEAAVLDCEASLCLEPTHWETLELYNKAAAKAEPQSS